MEMSELRFHVAGTTGKSAKFVSAREALILTGTEVGAKLSTLAQITGLSSGTLSKRRDVARQRMNQNKDFEKLIGSVIKSYEPNQRQIEESKA
jgi:hypothetical protein